jgi:DNA polymerase-3 subunit beta
VLMSRSYWSRLVVAVPGLSTLPANDFPTVEGPGSLTFNVASKLRRLIQAHQLCHGSADVRYYLNGMLLEVQTGILHAVATDGHRLAMCSMDAAIEQVERHQVIVPPRELLELALAHRTGWQCQHRSWTAPYTRDNG